MIHIDPNGKLMLTKCDLQELEKINADLQLRLHEAQEDCEEMYADIKSLREDLIAEKNKHAHLVNACKSFLYDFRRWKLYSSMRVEGAISGLLPQDQIEKLVDQLEAAMP